MPILPTGSHVCPGVCGAVAVGALMLVISACGSSSAPPATRVELTVTLDAGVASRAPQSWDVACPSPSHVAACARLIATKDAFAPPPPNSPCTMIYGGPEVLMVTGRVGTRQVDYRTGRANGCEIADYSRDLALVVPFRSVGQTPTVHPAG